MHTGTQTLIASIVTRVMREGGCSHKIDVSNVRSNRTGWSATATVTAADGASAVYRAQVPSGCGKVRVTLT